MRFEEMLMSSFAFLNGILVTHDFTQYTIEIGCLCAEHWCVTVEKSEVMVPRVEFLPFFSNLWHFQVRSKEYTNIMSGSNQTQNALLTQYSRTSI